MQILIKTGRRWVVWPLFELCSTTEKHWNPSLISVWLSYRRCCCYLHGFAFHLTAGIGVCAYVCMSGYPHWWSSFLLCRCKPVLDSVLCCFGHTLQPVCSPQKRPWTLMQRGQPKNCCPKWISPVAFIHQKPNPAPDATLQDYSQVMSALVRRVLRGYIQFLRI